MSTRAGALRGYQVLGPTLLADYAGPLLAVRFVRPGTVRIRLAPTGTFARHRSWSPVSPDEDFEPPPVSVSENAGGVEISSELLTVRAEPDGARVTVTDRRGGDVLLSDGPDGGPEWSGASGGSWTRRMPGGRHFFGLGERTGRLDKRGRRHSNWCTDRFEEHGPGTDELYLAIPYYLAMDATGRCHGLLLNNTYRSTFDQTDEHGERQVLRVSGGELDQYVFAGPTPAEVVARYTELTGRMPLPPRWALGYHHARWAYSTADVVLGAARRLRTDDIPADVLVIDIEHQRGYRNFTWDPQRFGDPAWLVAELARMGMRAALVVDVGIKYEPEGGYPVFTEGAEGAYFLPEEKGLLLRHVWPGLCAFPDFARREVREWWSRWHDHLLALGIRCVINDMNEPSMRDRPPMDPGAHRVEPPPWTPHGTGEERTTHAEVHNVYADLENAATGDALCRSRPDERHLLLSRAGFAGVQREAAVWTGDNASYWEHLEMSLPQLMNLGLSGVPFVGADIGGFYADAGPELLARWYQLGAFYPLARSNSAKGCTDQEPWAWGPRIEAVCRRALALRYRLLPYLYTVFAEAARTGAPILRPLLFHYGADPLARLRDDEALLGRDLLLAPVLHPGRDSRDVYLPGDVWYPLAGGPRVRGPARVIADAPLDADPPLFARGGAVLPFGPDLHWTDEHPLDPLTLEVYPDADGRAEGTLYEDDGVTLAYQRGESAMTRYAYRDGVLTARRDGGFVPAPRAVRVRVHRDDGSAVEHHLVQDDQEWSVGRDRD